MKNLEFDSLPKGPDGSPIIGGSAEDLRYRNVKWERDRDRRTLTQSFFVTPSGQVFYTAGEAQALPSTGDFKPRQYRVRTFPPPRI